MSFDLIFSAANVLAMLGWAGLILLPGRKWVTSWIAGLAIPALLSVAYAGLIAAFWAGAEGGFSSLAEVQSLFQTPGLLLAGWLHYLAFDLFVGAWEVRTARAEGIRTSFRAALDPHLPVRPRRPAPLPGAAHHPRPDPHRGGSSPMTGILMLPATVLARPPARASISARSCARRSGASPCSPAPASSSSPPWLRRSSPMRSSRAPSMASTFGPSR